MTKKHHATNPPASKASSSPYVTVTILFRDALGKPIEGLSVQIKARVGAQSAPAWKFGTLPENDPVFSAAAIAHGGASALGGASPSEAVSASKPDGLAEMVSNKTEAVTDKDGYGVTIRNAERNQPIDVFVKSQRGEFVPKATVTPKKDISAFVINSPEYHLEETTKLTPKEELEQNLNLPVVVQNEVMTVERLIYDFGPYITWAQTVTEQGKVKKDNPTRHKETVKDEKTGKKKTNIMIEHHYRIVNAGKPTTIALNVLGSRLNYPKTIELSDAKLHAVAEQLKVEVAALKAVAETESSGSGFLDNGLPKILFERHYFFHASLPIDKRGNGWTDESNPFPKSPDLCFPSSGGYSKGKPKESMGWGAKTKGDDGVMYQYQRMLRAAQLNFPAAIMACSWGAFQVMGYFYKECGYATPTDLANKMMLGVDEQFDLFVAYMTKISGGALEALRKKQWGDFARSYNGSGFPQKYPQQMERYYIYFK